MSRSPTPQVPKGSVRNIISIFENQSTNVDNESVHLLRRAKSMGSLTQRPTKHSIERIDPERHVDYTQVEHKNLELAQIDQQVQHLTKNVINGYKAYSRESHIYYQNQIVFTLTDVGNVETRNNPKTINKKSELFESLKRVNKKLNALLPAGEDTVIVTKIKLDTRSKSIEGKREVKINRKEPSVEREVKMIKREPSVDKQEVVRTEEPEEEDEVDSAAVSVRTLKQMFEKNTNENEGKAEFGATKISRKFLTFNSSSDFKYVPYSQKFKSSLDAEFNVRQKSISKENSFDDNSSRQMAPGSDDEERVEDLSPDSLSNEDLGSNSGSDSERNSRDTLEDQE